MATATSNPSPSPSPLASTARTTTTNAVLSERNTTTQAETDPFDTLLTLEDQFYSEGHAEGLADGEAAGRAEGRQLGLERGFAKFAEAGRLQGRAIVWANRLRESSRPVVSGEGDAEGAAPGAGAESEGASEGRILPPLAHSARLAKHVSALYALAETESLSTENTDEAVDDFDDRLRRAQGRVKVIERMVGEEGGDERLKGSDGDGSGLDPGSGGK